MSLTPEQIAEGWVAWNDPEPPVAGNSMVEVMWQSLSPKYTSTGPAKIFDWLWIIAYRPEPKP